ncbi:Helix-turn-helix domain-containing protein [Lentzea xinjiangensis]|uniref:Helix-turn-helix domain-containing protein n=1 Tax=Lentzea xinjiangensis TaxID=402600 RepID=A0A1H9HKN8_9PSEU|nr:helix-turn-helix transcriptional regulator [Lentzea xinjiangensis]SEQ62911.1 Helix-turn-helix domain-containing protein [Lentzea xinjiangensis]
MPKNFTSNLQNRAVARALTLWRQESGLSLSEVGKRVHWSSAKTSIMQNGLTLITDADVMALALAYGINEERRAPAFHGAQRARDPRTFDLLTGGGVPCVEWTYPEVEREANHLQVVALDVLPPLVRTPEYSAGLGSAQVGSVAARDHRQYLGSHREQVLRKLADGVSLRMDLVVGESVLRKPVGSALVMADQLFGLASLAELAAVQVFLVPDDVAAFAGAVSFSVLSFREAQFDTVVYLDQLHGGTWLESEFERRPYVDTHERLMDVALPVDVTTERIVEAAQHFKNIAS